MKGRIYAFLAVALFSLYVVFGKVLLETVSPFIILVLNQALAALIIIMVMKLAKKIKEFKDTSKKDLKYIFLIAIFTSVVGPLLFLIGLKLTSAANTVLLVRFDAVLTALFAIIVFKDKITKHQIIGTFIMFLGVVIIVTKTFSLGLNFNIGDIFILISATSYAAGTITFKKYFHHIPPEVVVSLRNLFGALILFVISLFFVDYSIIPSILSARFVLALLGLVILTTIIAQWCWYKALEITSATNVSLIALSSPFIALVYTIVLLKESLDFSQVFGGIIILIGLIILEFHFKKVNHKKHHLKAKHWPHV